MYKCGKCNYQVKENISAMSVVTKIRKKTYEKIVRDKKKNIIKDYRGKPEKILVYGSEIVEELKMCKRCFDTYNNRQPIVINNK